MQELEIRAGFGESAVEDRHEGRYGDQGDQRTLQYCFVINRQGEVVLDAEANQSDDSVCKLVRSSIS